MNNKIINLALIALVAVGCKQDEPIVVSPASFTEVELAICKNSKCPEVTINYVKVTGDEEISKKINTKLNGFIISSLLLGEDSIPTAKTIPEAATDFIEIYNADRAQFPDMAGEYFAEISVTELYNAPELLCFEMDHYLYTGGAHGYGTTTFMNLDPKTGNELTAKQLFKNNKKFVSFVEKKFRKEQNIPENQSINNTGFWFENETFYLPESVGFMQDSIIFVYNQYDIASYADGPIELKIAIKDAQPYLNIH